jgi:hypothetical protein
VPPLPPTSESFSPKRKAEGVRGKKRGEAPGSLIAQSGMRSRLRATANRAAFFLARGGGWPYRNTAQPEVVITVYSPKTKNT